MTQAELKSIIGAAIIFGDIENEPKKYALLILEAAKKYAASQVEEALKTTTEEANR